MYRSKNTDLTYTNYNVWESNKFNNTTSVGWAHSYSYKNGKGKILLELNNSSVGSDYDYSKLTFTSVHKNTIGKLKFNTRIFGQYGTGSNWANESKLYLAGANSEEMSENKFTRSAGFVPDEWLGYGATTNHFHMGGGLNLRGYSGYLAPELNAEGEYVESFSGESGASISAELEFQNLLPIVKIFNSPLTTYLFADAGIINISEVTSENIKDAFSDVRTDAGVGVALTIRKWGALQMVKPLTVRVDFPFFLNKYPDIDEDSYQTNRFVVGIGRTF
jgi:aminopeptidase N